MERPKWESGWFLDESRQWKRWRRHPEASGDFQIVKGPRCSPRIDHLIDQAYREAGFSEEMIAELNEFTEQQVEVMAARRRIAQRLRNPRG